MLYFNIPRTKKCSIAMCYGGGVVPTGGGQDGLGDLVGDALVLEFPDVCAQGAFGSKRKNRELVLNRTGSRGKWMRY